MTATIETEKLTETVGARVLGVDVDRLLHDDELPGWTLDALEANGVLVLRDLHIDDASQVAFSKRLGRVEVFGKGENPEIFLITLDPAKNPVADYLRGTFDWHIDGLTDDIPIMATLLSAHGVADSGGETEFASTYAAYEDLTDDEKQRFESIRVVHSIEAAQRRLVAEPTEAQLAMWRSRPAKEQPLIWRHRSGRRSVVLGPTADHVVDMDPEEGDAVLADVLERATAPERVYRHEWQVGDLVIWDNRGVLHRALPYDPASPRDMHRTTLHGDEEIR
ncbi:MAG TPA: TauD/TfdA family dioxygenase [Acidimicrobiales bacterium]|nr:TauD/TfdA family dioxygenase [Acidimicrobiales bacterium]